MDDESIRLYLHNQLLSVFPDLVVYYRPAGNIILERPCIIYEPKATEPAFANNTTYVAGTRFQITILSELPLGYSNKRKAFDMVGVTITSNNTYVANDVVHDVFVVSVNTIK